jgi:hypothetical protein
MNREAIWKSLFNMSPCRAKLLLASPSYPTLWSLEHMSLPPLKYARRTFSSRIGDSHR